MITLMNPDADHESLSREITASNERCHNLKRRIERTLKRSREVLDSIQPIVHLLEAYRDELALHFALEIASDSFKDAISRASRLSKKAEELLKEQEYLYTEFCDVAELLHRYADDGLRRVPQTVIDRWNLFNRQLRKHDAAERELIYEAFFVDIGGGD